MFTSEGGYAFSDLPTDAYLDSLPTRGSCSSLFAPQLTFSRSFYDALHSQNNPIFIEVSVSEKNAFINPENDIKGEPLFLANGTIRDITPSTIADTAVFLLSVRLH
jgi:hypothetical protein